MTKKKSKRTGPWVTAEVSSQVTREFPILELGTAESYYVFAREKCRNFTYAFHQIYNRCDESEDKSFIKEIEEKFNMSDIEYRSCKTSATGLRNSEIELDNSREEDIHYYESVLSDSESESKDRFNARNKIASLQRQLGSTAVFGSVGVMRKLTNAYNRVKQADCWIPKYELEIIALQEQLDSESLSKKDKRKTKYQIESKKRSINDYNRLREKAIERISRLKEELQQKRMLDAFLMGEANQKGNRFVDFDLCNGVIELKITGCERYEVHIKIPKKFLKEIMLVQELIEKKELSVSVLFSEDTIKLQYDLAKVNGYAVDEKARRKEVKKIKEAISDEEEQKQLIKDVYKKYYKDQRDRMIVGKIEGRCIAVDLNPGYIGFSILQRKNNETGYKIICCGRISWEVLMKKLKKASSSAKLMKQNRRRKNAVYLAFKLLFKQAMHYRCSEFIMENLEFSNHDDSNKTTEANRKINNLWHKEISEKTINRRCVESGITLVKINACYTSFIGAIQHDYSDPTDASIEIGRRGLMRYTKDAFYPLMSQRDRDTMMSIAKDGDAGDAHDFTCSTWPEAYQSIKRCFKKKADFEHRYRTNLNETSHRFKWVRQRYYNSGIKFIVFR